MINFSTIHTRSAVGIHAQSIAVEVHLANGLPHFTIVGLPETAVRESKDRVRSAIINSQFEFPCRRITVNLAPAHLPKAGSGFDLPIAIGILAASLQIPSDQLDTLEFIGELALNGQIRGVTSIIPMVLAADEAQNQLIIAQENAEEAAITQATHVFTAETLREVCAYLCKNAPLPALPALDLEEEGRTMPIDWSDVKGQAHAKYALEIAACGGHSVLLAGSPGSGKTMLAKRFATILPDLTNTHALECAAIYSICRKKFNILAWKRPPFRSPHHTASTVALVGGGNPPKPGEISLAHRGVLFLDELPEFQRHTLETLREPIESGEICLSRAAQQIEFPAQFQFIAAMNPCPCGQWGNPLATCVCSLDRIQRYLNRLSAPLLDRIDMHIQVHPLLQDELIPMQSKSEKTPNSAILRQRVTDVQQRQLERQGCLNAALLPTQYEEICQLEPETQHFVRQAMKQLNLSARAYYRLLKVARTIADYEQSDIVTLTAVQQALGFRQMLNVPKPY